jgi:hypothetical protein
VKRTKTAESSARPGPLAPWRFSLAVGAAAITTGLPLVDATRSGYGIDAALGRSFGVAALVWIAAGVVNRVVLSVTTTEAEPGPSGPAEERSSVEVVEQ